MGSIIKKKVKNYIYYYYVESKRINGKPKRINQKYLGTAENLLSKLKTLEIPLQERALYSDVAEFGASTLLFDIASRIGICDIIDRRLPKRNQGVSTGSYILTEAINRAVSPTSTNELCEWYSGTCLPSIMGHGSKAFSPQNFWNNTKMEASDINAIEDAVLKEIISTYDIDTSHLIYDATNFFTYIDTLRDVDCAKLGHSKEKRNDLRIVGLSLLVTSECNIPLLHDTYPGSCHDTKEFRFMMEQLKKRYETISGRNTDVTIVFDRGNNSEDNITFLEEGDVPFHYVGGLTCAQAMELFEVPLSDYAPLMSKNLEGLSAYRCRKKAFGREVTVVSVYNPALEEGQLQGILINIDKTKAKLLLLEESLMKRANGETKKGRKPTVQSVTDKIKTILHAEYMSDIFSYKVMEENGEIYLSFAASEEALVRIRTTKLGKNALFTDRDDFTTEEIVTAYRSAWHVEAAFKQLKNADHLHVRPVFHWTDKRIRVHIFTCVLAYRLCCLLIKELKDKGVETNINELLTAMAGLRKVETFFGDINKPEKVSTFTIGTDLAERVENLYHLKEKYS